MADGYVWQYDHPRSNERSVFDFYSLQPFPHVSDHSYAKTDPSIILNGDQMWIRCFEKYILANENTFSNVDSAGAVELNSY